MITSYNLPHDAPLDTRVISSIESLTEQFRWQHRGEELPVLPKTLTPGTYGHAIHQRMHNGDKHDLFTKLEAKASRGEGTIPYGLERAPYIRSK